MAGLTVGTLVAVMQLRAEQFLTANRQAQAGLQATAAEATRTAVATERTDAAFVGLGQTTGIINNRLKDTSGTFIAASAGADKLAIANERLRTAQLQVIAAQERYDKVMATGTATDGEKAAAAARLSAAETRVAIAANQSAEAMARQGAAAATAAAETEAAAAKQTASASRGLAGIAATVAKTGALLGGVALVFSVAEIAKNGNEFTHAMNTLGAVSGAAAPQLAAARAQAIAMGKDLTIPKVTATDAATAMEDLVKAGVSLERAMSAARPALLLAAAANVDVADSARVTGDLLDEWGFSADKAGHVADIMATAANSAGGGLMDLFSAMKYVGPSARQLGAGFDYTTAALVQLAKAGIQGSMAGTSLRNMLTRLSPQGAPATAALNDLGVAAFDATGHFKGLPVVFDQLHAAAERLSPQRFAADVSTAFGARALQAVQIFAHGGSEALQQFYDKIESGDVQKIADKMNVGVGAAFAQLGKEFSAAGLDIYNAVQGPVATAVEWIGHELPKAFTFGKNAVSELAHDASALAPAWTAVSATVSGAAHVIASAYDFLQGHGEIVTRTAETVALMWLAWKGANVAVAAATAVGNALTAMSGTAVTTAREASLAWNASMLQTGSAATSSTEIIIAALAARQAAATTAAAEVSAAAEGEAAAVTAAAETEAAAGAVAEVGIAGLAGPVAALAAGLGFLGFQFMNSGDSAKHAATDIGTFTSALKEDGGAVGAHTRDLIEMKLAQAGAYDSAKQLGISFNDVTKAVEGGQPSIDSMMKKLRDLQNSQSDTDHGNAVIRWAQTLSNALYDLEPNITGAITATNQLTEAQGPGQQAAAATAQQLDQVKQQLGGLAGATDAASMAAAAGLVDQAAYTTGLAAMQAALGGNKTAAQGLSDTLAALNGTLSQRGAQDSFLDAQAQLKQALDASAGSLDQNNDKGRAADEAFLGAIKSAQDYAIATAQVTGSIPASIDAYNQSIEALFQTAQQTGATKEQMDALRTAVDTVPELKQILTQVLGDQTAKNQLGDVAAAVAAIPSSKAIDLIVNQIYKQVGTPVDPSRTGTTTNGAGLPIVPGASVTTGVPGHVTGGHAAGGLISAPGNGYADTVLSPVANREFILRAAAVNKVGVQLPQLINRGDLEGAAAVLAAKGYGRPAASQSDPRVLQALNLLADRIGAVEQAVHTNTSATTAAYTRSVDQAATIAGQRAASGPRSMVRS